MKYSRIFSTTFFRMSCTMILLAGILVVPSARVRALDTTFIVNTTADSPDPDHGNGICGNGLVCSLRAAIEEASGLIIPFGTRVIINFSGIPQNSVLELSYGSIAWEGDYITVEGGTNNITVSGSGMLSGSDSIFHITGHDNILENLSVRESPRHGIWIGSATAGNSTANILQYLNIYENNGAGVFIEGLFVDNNVISYNRIGASSSSTTCSAEVNNAMDGVATYNADVYGTVISYNYIVCNGFGGVYLGVQSGKKSHNAIIEGNFIGTDGVHSGLGNAWAGIEATGDVDTSIVNNIISGNGQMGIELEGSTGANIYSNRIGTTASGNAAIPNGQDGILVTLYNSDISSAITIGSATDAAKKNIISGNTACGVKLTGGSHDVVLDGNYIGLDVNGMTAIPNGEAGVAIINSDNNVLSTDGESTLPQFISGNSREGIYISNSMGTDINKKTFIGVAADYGTSRGNGLEGVKLDTGTTYTEIYSQKIVHNGGAGIALVNSASITGNYLMPWFVGRNVGLPIDLGDDGFTSNGSQVPPGPNGWQNYPVPSLMTADGFYGQTCADCEVYIFRAVNDPTKSQGGGGSPGLLTASPTGEFSYTFPADVMAVTMVACDPGNSNCSEMSPRVLNPTWHYIYLPLVKK